MYATGVEVEARFRDILDLISFIAGFFLPHTGYSDNKVFQWRVSQGILSVFDWMMAVEASVFPRPFFFRFS